MDAFGYIRVSTTEQGKNDLSLEYQEAQIKLYCKLREWNLAAIFSDACSARDTNRPAFREMYARMLAGGAKVLVFVRFNRAFRNFNDANQKWNEFQAGGLEFASIREQIDTSTPMGRAMMRMTWIWDELDRENTSERNREIPAHQKAMGLKYGGVPYGYREIPTGKMRRDKPVFRLEVDPAEQAVIARMLQLRKEGWGYRRIARLLNAERIPTKKAGQEYKEHQGRRTGKPATYAGVWHASTVRDVLMRAISESSSSAGRTSPSAPAGRQMPPDAA
jgi:site-specific DNA recombinase